MLAHQANKMQQAMCLYWTLSVLAGILAGKADRVLSVDHGAADRGVAAVDSVDQAVSAVDMDTGMADEVAGAAMKKADTVAVEAVVAEDVAATDGTTTDGITATAGEVSKFYRLELL